MSVKAGFIYLLTHPSDPCIIKVGMTTRSPETRLKEHNTQFGKAAGKIVKDTGMNWEIKKVFAVQDVHNAENAFFQRHPLTEIPGLLHDELVKLDEKFITWEWVEQGLEAAKAAGIRRNLSQPPIPKSKPKRGSQWILAQIDGSGIKPIKGPGNGIMNVVWICSKGHEFKLDGNTLARLPYCPRCEPDKFDVYTLKKVDRLDSSAD